MSRWPCRARFKGKTGRLYGDVMLELDWSVGQIVDAVKRNGLDDDTLIMFASDNGPWLIYGDHAGSAGPLREGKQTTFEGGLREPFIARWPGHIRPDTVVRSRVMSFDIFPTLVKLAGAEVPADRIIDGRDIWPWLSGRRTSGEPHEALYFFAHNGRDLNAVNPASGSSRSRIGRFMRCGGRGGERGTRRRSTCRVALRSRRGHRRDDQRRRAARGRREAVDEIRRARPRGSGRWLDNRAGKNLRPPATQLPPNVSPLPDGVPVPPPARGRGAA